MLTLFAAVVVLAVAQVTFGAPVAGAQSADRIAANLNDSGVFVESGAEGTTNSFADVIARLATVGVDLHIVSLGDDEPDVEGLARSLRDKTGGTVLVITPGQLAGASDSFDDGEVLDAIDIAFDDFNADLATGALSFGEALADRRAPTASGTPTTAATTTAVATSSTVASHESAADSAGSDGGGGSSGGVLIFLVIVVGGIVGLVLFLRSKNRKRVGAAMADRKTVVVGELEEIGVEIVDLADKVSVGENDEATAHFRKANEQFLTLQERLEGASSLWEITEIDHEADMTGWHLDAAAALLDGQRVPDEPERPLDGPPAAPPRGLPAREGRDDEGADDIQTGAGDRDRASDRERVTSRLDKRRERTSSRTQAPSTRRDTTPRQERRSERRQSWPAPKVSGGGGGGALGGILKSVLVGGVLGGGGNSRSPRGWDGAGAVTTPTRPRRSQRSQRPSNGSASRTRSSRGTGRGGSASRTRGSSGGSATRKRG